MSTSTRSVLLFATAAAAALLHAQAASAQTAAAPAKTAQVQEVIVTAQRYEQRLQETPVAVTALSAANMEQLNLSNTRDLMLAVPSLQVSTLPNGDGGGSATFFLRGMGQQRSGNGSEAGVGVYVDDFYYPSLSGSVFELVDLSQVEVLRGPQGTLFGRNTIGGAIRYTTRGPTLGKLEGHLSGTLGSNVRRDLSGALNVPLGEMAALRVSGGRLSQEGFVHSQNGAPDAGGTETRLVRAQLRFEPTSRISIDLSTQWSNFYLDGFSYNQPAPLAGVLVPPGQPDFAAQYNFGGPFNGFTTAASRGQPLFTDAFGSQCFYCQAGAAPREFSETTYTNAFATIRWEINDNLTLNFLTGRQVVKNSFSNDSDGTPAFVLSLGLSKSKIEAESQEFQLNGVFLDNRLNFVSGAYYYFQHNTPTFVTIAGYAAGLTPPLPFLVSALEDRKLRSYAGYFNGSYKLTDALTLLAGIRYSQDKKRVLAFNQAGGPILETNEATFNSTTFRVGAQYQWTPDIMTYATVSTGFRAGGFNPYIATIPAPPRMQAFEPEKATSYEAGARMQFLDRRVTVNPTVFYVDWNKIQVQSVMPFGGVAIIILQNAGTARSYGAELEGSFQVTEGLRIFGNLAYLNLKYTDIGTASGITLKSKLQRAPEWTYSVGASYTYDLNVGGSITGTFTYSFEDDQFSSPTDNDKVLLPSYAVANARIEYRSPESRYTVAAFVTNLFEEKYAVGGLNFGVAGIGGRHYDLGRPREFGVTARVAF